MFPMLFDSCTMETVVRFILNLSFAKYMNIKS